MIVTIKGGCKLETEELINYFDNIILPYERKLFNRNFNMQEVLLEELMNSVKTEFLNILSNSSEAGEEWFKLEKIFFPLLLGILEDRNHSELNNKLKKFSYTVVEVISNLS